MFRRRLLPIIGLCIVSLFIFGNSAHALLYDFKLSEYVYETERWNKFISKQLKKASIKAERDITKDYTALNTDFKEFKGNWKIFIKELKKQRSPVTLGTASSGPTATHAPEPATILLIGAGLAGLAGFGRKKFK